MSLGFLSPQAEAASGGGTPIARSPMERRAVAAGGRLAVRHGWNVVTGYGGGDERAAWRETVGWADVSWLGKLEIQASAGELADIADRAGGALRPGHAVRCGAAWWCAVTPERALVICDAGARAGLLDSLQEAAPVDLSTAHAALTIAGPQAREVFARFCALDLRPRSMPIGAFRPASVARTPGYVLREDDDRFLMLFGAALGQYVWDVVADAATHLGGAPVGADALTALAEPAEAGSHA